MVRIQNMNKMSSASRIMATQKTSESTTSKTQATKYHKGAKFDKVLLTSIVVDDRERQVIPFFEEYENIRVSTGRVTTGDYAIVIKDEKTKEHMPVVIIERKTWKDFSDSIKDGRMSNNSNLEEFRQKFGCKIVFIVEGAPFPAPNRKFRGIPFKNIQKKIDKMILVDGYHIIQTRDPKMTAQRIVELSIAYDQYYDDIKSERSVQSNRQGDKSLDKSLDKSKKTAKTKSTKTLDKSKKSSKSTKESDDSSESSNSSESDDSDNSESSDLSDSESDNIVVVKGDPEPEVDGGNFVISSELTKVRTKTNDRILQEMWISLPQVSIATAKILSEKWSISDIVSGKVFEMDIADLKYPSGVRIGNERAKKILIIAKECKGNGNVATLKQSIEFTKAQEKLLRSINGVSAIVAKQICKKYTLKQLCEKITEKELAQVKRSDQPTAKNIGPAIAKKIMTLLKTKNE